MPSPKVIASILSWNSDVPTVRRSLTIFRSEVDHVIICDNGSRSEVQAGLKELGKEFGDFVSFVWNGENLGNAAGLNRGVSRAMELGADWIMPIDDNSVPTPGMTRLLLEAYGSLSPTDQERVGMVKPNHTTAKGLAFKQGPPFIMMGGFSSGEIVKADVYRKVGLYLEGLFIDAVDSEFAHRAYRKGITSLIVPDAILEHKLGHPVIRKFLWMTAAVPNYPPSRYYYISRNNAYLYLRNFNEYFIHGENKAAKFWAFIVPRYLIKAVLFEDHKAEKVRIVLRGTWDGLRGKLGKLQQ